MLWLILTKINSSVGKQWSWSSQQSIFCCLFHSSSWLEQCQCYEWLYILGWRSPFPPFVGWHQFWWVIFCCLPHLLEDKVLGRKCWEEKNVGWEEESDGGGKCWVEKVLGFAPHFHPLNTFCPLNKIFPSNEENNKISSISLDSNRIFPNKWRKGVLKP